MPVRYGRFEMPKTLTKDESTATDTYAKFVAELCLGNFLFDPPQPDSLAKLDVWLAGTALLHLLCR